MNAPPPRTADGKPDLSGLWRGGGGGPARGRGAAATLPRRPVRRSPGFATSARTSRRVCRSRRTAPRLLKTRQAGNSKDNPEAHCLPMGIVQLHTQGAPRKFIQTPRELVILYEASSERREIFTDGRAAADRRPAALVQRLLGRPLGGRHARRRDRPVPRRRMARHQRQPAHRRRESHRALPPADVRAHGDRRHHRGQEGLHASRSPCASTSS